MPQVDGMAPTFSTKPTIRQDGDDQSTLLFHCSIVADPRPAISWSRNGVKVQDGDAKFQVILREVDRYTTDCRLILKDVTVEDAGKYKVTARNDLGESNATISLNFDSDEAPIPKGRGVKPTFTERPVIRQAEDDSGKVVFECRLAGDPRPEVAWYHNDARLTASSRHRMTLEELEAGNKLFYVCRLEIAGVEASDVGAYRAVARNADGEGHATINLNFEDDVQPGGGGRPRIPDGIPPRFPKKPTIRQEGDNLVMECLLEAHPLPEITWFKGDKVLHQSAHHQSNGN